MVASVLAALVFVACSGSESESDAEATDAGGDEIVSTAVETGRDVRRPAVRLAVTDWTAARLNVAIAEHLIERRLGYPVEPVAVEDFPTMLADLEAGRLDAVLELWPSSLDPEEQAVIDRGGVEELGPLGVEGRIGWWVPRYVAEGDLGVTDWTDLADPTVAAAFADPTTGSRGRLLGTNPAYLQYDEELVDELDLPFEVVYSGSDAATEAEVAAAVAAGRPILLYWWTPTALVARHDLVNVALPERTDACVEAFEAGEPLACDYPVDRLFKLGAPDLAERAPEVHRFLGAFELTTDDQLELIDRVENQGVPLDRAVDAWVAANQDRWEAWFS